MDAPELVTEIRMTFFARRFFASLKLKKTKMPPKKQQNEPKLLLGRPSNNLKMGVVGLPNVGKSKALLW